MLKTLPIHRLISLGFGLIVIVFIINGSISFSGISKLQNISDQIFSLRTPTTEASSSMVYQIHKSQASLRGWLLLNEEHFDNDLRESWVKIRTTEETIEQLSKKWTNPDNQVHFKAIQTLLNDFERIQFDILEISALPENIPANLLTTKKAVPLVLLLNNKVLQLIAHEETIEATPERKNFLLALIKFRNSLGLSLGNIHSYLLSGDKDFIGSFEESWSDNQQHFDDLNNMQPIFKSHQKRIFNDVIKNSQEFSELPAKIFELRGKDDWNQAKFLLRTKAEPISQQIINTLKTMTSNQHHLLQLDNEAMAISTYNFKNNLLILTLLAIIFTIWLGLIISRRSSVAQKLIENRAELIDQNIMIAHLDNKGIIKDISNSLCRTLGGIKTDFIGKQSYFFLSDKDRAPLYDDIIMMVHTGQVWSGEIERINEDNERVWLHSKLIPTHDHHGDGEGYTNILQNITDKKRLEEISITDKLTSLFNRRHFDIVILQQLKLARRNGKTITLCILDIDYFKEYNDHYGHQAGDNALTLVAHSLKQGLKRPDDFVFRLGGEEFGVIINGMDAPHITEILNKIQHDVESLFIKHEYSKVHEHLTVSIGAIIYTSIKDLQVDDFYLSADKALYEAKKKRNCIVIELK